MKKFLLALAALLPAHAFACTVFESPFPGDTRYAHNVDWYEQYPNTEGMLTLNAANLQKTAELLGAPVAPALWTSLYRSVTFSIAGAEFPVSGFNEKGLSMAILELAPSTYPALNDPRPALGVSQFVQYNLDRSTTIDDVIASDKDLRPYSSIIHMHYFACDATGACAVIQYIDGKMRAYRGADLPFKVLTNSLYNDGVAAARACIADSYQCTPADDSLFRFANAARIGVEEMKSPADFETDAFKALGDVAQVGPGTITRFQMVFDPAGRKVHVRKRGVWTEGDLAVDFDRADCRKPREFILIDESAVGDLSPRWQPLTEAFQADMAAKMGYPAKIAHEYGSYPFHGVKCTAP